MIKKKKIYAESLGCPKNRVDLEVFLAGFLEKGWIMSDFEEADLIILNSCGFLEEARKETIERFLELCGGKKPGAKTVLAGCLPQLYPEIHKELVEADFVVGMNHIGDLADFIDKNWGEKASEVLIDPDYLYSSQNARVTTLSPFWAYVKIADGCGNFCSYCSIPYIRGSYRERPVADIKKEVRRLVESGFKEIILIAQDTTNYGLRKNSSLAGLLEELESIKGNFMIRIMYMYPSRITKEILKIIAQSTRVVPYFEVPIQHVCDKVLNDMNRSYGSKDIERVLGWIDEIFGDRAVKRTSLITGFPTETKADFNELLRFIAEDHFDYTGVFGYSKESLTKAGKMRSLPSVVIASRKKEAEQAAAESMERRLKRFVGREMTVLFEEFDSDSMLCTGRGAHQAPEIDGITILANVEKEKPGTILKTKITGRDGIDFIAEIIK